MHAICSEVWIPRVFIGALDCRSYDGLAAPVPCGISVQDCLCRSESQPVPPAYVNDPYDSLAGKRSTDWRPTEELKRSHQDEGPRRRHRSREIINAKHQLPRKALTRLWKADEKRRAHAAYPTLMSRLIAKLKRETDLRTSAFSGRPNLPAAFGMHHFSRKQS